MYGSGIDFGIKWIQKDIAFFLSEAISRNEIEKFLRIDSHGSDTGIIQNNSDWLGMNSNPKLEENRFRAINERTSFSLFSWHKQKSEAEVVSVRSQHPLSRISSSCLETSSPRVSFGLRIEAGVRGGWPPFANQLFGPQLYQRRGEEGLLGRRVSKHTTKRECSHERIESLREIERDGSQERNWGCRISGEKEMEIVKVK